ncbi:flavin reductase [Sulfurimonas sp. HSL-1656]|uniref:flavin reductase n=1 Tax=Thiomicrolovo subterrani TaxID=3131934 RepID=UPI0031F9708F
MLINYDAANAGDIYKLMSQSIIPRPIAWVVTESGSVVNVAPFSYFTGLSSKELEAHVSEAEQFAIPHTRPVPGYPPMIEGAPIAFFCDFHSEVDLGESKTIPLIVEIKAQFVDDACIPDKERMTIIFDPIARIGKSYAHIGEERTPPPIP